MSLVLYKTDFLLLDGDGPQTIDLKAPRTMIGRGSQTIHVDAAIFIRNNGADIISRRHAEITRTVEVTEFPLRLNYMVLSTAKSRYTSVPVTVITAKPYICRKRIRSFCYFGPQP